GAGVEQRSRDRDGVVGTRGLRNTRVAEVLQRLPLLRTARRGRTRWPLAEQAFDFAERSRDDGRVQARERDVRMLAQDVRRKGGGAAVDGGAQEVVGPLLGAASSEREIGEPFLERGPARKPKLERERVLDVAQRGHGRRAG